MRYRLICTDLDGTLLDDNKKISDRTRLNMKNAHDRGTKIALISGRMPGSMKLIEQELNIPCIKACNAGTYILSEEDQCISSHILSPEAMWEIYHLFAEKNHIPLWIFRERKWYVTEMDSYVEKEIKTIHHRPEPADIRQLAEEWKKRGTGPNKVLFAADNNLIRSIKDQMEQISLPNVKAACSGDTFLEIFPADATKGTALEIICRNLGISPEDTIAFGDHELDIPLIEAAGTGIAMGNAVENLKKRADYITKTNNEDGVACVLEQLLKD